MTLRGYLLVGVLAMATVGCDAVKPAPSAPEPASLETGDTCFQDRDFSCAAANYTGYLKAYPNDARAAAKLAISQTSAGHHREALPAYQKAVDLGVVTYDLAARYAESLEATGDIDGAIKWNRKALEIVPSLVDVRGTLAKLLARKGQTDEALKLLQSFDRDLVKKGHPPYFTAQISSIKEKAAAPH